MQRRTLLTSLVLLTSLTFIGGVFSYVSETRLYPEYRILSDYRRLHPNLVATPEMLHVVAVGHDTSFADILWIELMQFIGDNIANGQYLNFTHRILGEIQALSPGFARAYEFDLLFFPRVSPLDPPDVQEKKATLLKEGLQGYESRIATLCDMKKVDAISVLGYGTELWSRTDLKNPCISGMIPYYMATHYDIDLQDHKKAAYYYKIASMQDNAPIASRFLGIIATSTDGNFRDGALSFALLAADGYDEDPFTCRKLAESLVHDLSERIIWTPEWIDRLEKAEQQLFSPRSEDNPLVLAGDTCYEWIERSIKQVYVGYVTEKTQDLPEITTSQDLIEARIFNHVPTIQTHRGFLMHKQDGVWKYYLPQ